MRRILLMIAAAVPIAAASCSVATIAGGGGGGPIRIGDEWIGALPVVSRWSESATGRTFQAQDLDTQKMRVHAALDSLIIADAWRRAGLDHPMLRRFPASPRKAGILCKENYIFYLRGNRIVGVEYRAVESDGTGGHRQYDESIGEISDSPPTST